MKGLNKMFDGGGEASATMPSQLAAYSPKLKDKLATAVERAQSALADARRAQEILENNPQLEELINIMSRQRYL